MSTKKAPSLLLGARGIMSVTGHRSDEMANYYAQHADQIEINKKVVSAWDESTGGESARQEAAPGEIGLWPNESVTQGRRLVFAAFFCFPRCKRSGETVLGNRKIPVGNR
jgi:hypothetical protein